MGYFDDIILKTGIADEADRTTLLTLVEKNPSLRALVDKRDADATAWETWRKDHWNEDLRMSNETAAAVREAEQAKLRIAALEAAGLGGDVPFKFEDIEADLKKNGYVKADEAMNALNRSSANIENFLKRTFTLPAEYMAEFGGPPPADLLDKMLADYGPKIKVNPGADPRDSYNAIVATKREEIRAANEVKAKADQEKAIKDAEERGAARARQEIGMAPGAPGMPVDDFGAPSLNARANRVAAAEKAGDTAAQDILKAPLGSTAAAGLAWIQAQRNATHSVQ